MFLRLLSVLTLFIAYKIYIQSKILIRSAEINQRQTESFSVNRINKWYIFL